MSIGSLHRNAYNMWFTSIGYYFTHSVNAWFTKWRLQAQNSAACLFRLFLKTVLGPHSEKTGGKKNSIPSAKTHFSSSTSPPSWFPNMSSTRRERAFQKYLTCHTMPRKIYIYRGRLVHVCILHVPAGVHTLEIVWNNITWSWTVVVYR